MQIRGRILLLRAIVQCHVDLIERKLGRTKKIDISGCNGANKSLKMGKFSLSQASVNWKIVTLRCISLDYFYNSYMTIFTMIDFDDSSKRPVTTW